MTSYYSPSSSALLRFTSSLLDRTTLLELGTMLSELGGGTLLELSTTEELEAGTTAVPRFFTQRTEQ
jgi:hypothetical protein